MKNITAKRIAAWVAIVLLVGLYVTTLILALLNSPATNNLFMVSMICTILIPVMCWIFIWIFGRLTGKKTIADLNLMQDPEKPESNQDKDPSK